MTDPTLTDGILPHIPLHTTNEYILGKARWTWVVAACKAIIGSSNPHLRWLMVRAGFDEFRRVARQKFLADEPAIRFTDDELRWMFQVIEASLPERLRAAAQAKEIIKYERKPMDDKLLKGSGGEGPTGHDGPTDRHDGGIVTESLPERDKAPLIH